MSYSDAIRITHPLGSVATTGTVTRGFQGPAGRRGRVIAVVGDVTTTLTGTLRVQVGVTGTLAKFADQSFTPAAAPSGFAAETNLFSSPNIDKTEAPLVTFSGATAGAIDAAVVVDWF